MAEITTRRAAPGIRRSEQSEQSEQSGRPLIPGSRGGSRAARQAGTTSPPAAGVTPLGRRIGRRIGRRGLALGRGTIAIGVLLALWEVLPRITTGADEYVIEPSLLPPFSDVAQAWWELLGDGQLWANTQDSLVRSLTGFSFAVAAGVPIGLLIAWYRPVREILNPLLEVFRNTAPLALLPMFTLILGIGETSKIALVSYACLFPVVLNTITGAVTVDPLLVTSARSMGLGPAQLFRKVVLPAAVPSIFTGVRQAGASSILVLIAAEMVGAKAGLGYLINYAQFNFMIPEMYAGIITISGLGLAFNQALVSLERRASRWREDI